MVDSSFFNYSYLRKWTRLMPWLLRSAKAEWSVRSPSIANEVDIVNRSAKAER